MTPWKVPDLPDLLDSDCTDCEHAHYESEGCFKPKHLLLEAILKSEEEDYEY